MKLLKQKRKNQKTTKCSNQKRRARKAAKPARVIQIWPVDQAAAHNQRVKDHMGKLQLINSVYSESTRDCYQDSELSFSAKKAQLRNNMRSVGASLGAWHCEALDIVTAGTKLKANFADQHKELTRALAFFDAPK